MKPFLHLLFIGISASAFAQSEIQADPAKANEETSRHAAPLQSEYGCARSLREFTPISTFASTKSCTGERLLVDDVGDKRFGAYMLSSDEMRRFDFSSATKPTFSDPLDEGRGWPKGSRIDFYMIKFQRPYADVCKFDVWVNRARPEIDVHLRDNGSLLLSYADNRAYGAEENNGVTTGKADRDRLVEIFKKSIESIPKNGAKLRAVSKETFEKHITNIVCDCARVDGLRSTVERMVRSEPVQSRIDHKKLEELGCLDPPVAGL